MGGRRASATLPVVATSRAMRAVWACATCAARTALLRRGGSGHKDLPDLPIRGPPVDRTDFVAALDQGAIECLARLLVAQRQVGTRDRAPLPAALGGLPKQVRNPGGQRIQHVAGARLAALQEHLHGAGALVVRVE